MAQPVIAIGTSHGPQLVTQPRDWSQRVEADRVARHFHHGTSYSFDELVRLNADRDLAAQLTPEMWELRHGKCQDAIAGLAQRLAAAKPDVAIIFGNDQSEIFTDNIPAFAVYTGETIDNLPRPPELVAKLPPGIAAAERGYAPPVAARYRCVPELAHHLLKELCIAGFDVAQLARIPTGPGGHNTVPHAYGFVYRRLMRDDVIPNVPLIINTHYEPNRPRAARCIAFGRAVARAVRSWPSEARVALIASGGLTHYVVDEEFDRMIIEAMRQRDFARLEAVPEEMFLSGGTSEIKNWLPVAAAAAEFGMTMTLLDYVPCYRSKAGTGTAMAFAYWTP